MRILVCAAEAPLPPLNGFRAQLSHLLSELAGDHELRVAAFVHPGQEGEPPPGVELVRLPGARPRGRAVLRAARHGLPLGVAATADEMRRAASQLLAERPADLVHVAGSALAAIAPSLGGTPAVLAALDAWHLNRAAAAARAPALLRGLYRLDERRVRRFGTHAYRPFDAVVFVSDEDARAARELDPSIRAEVIPNGVDAEAFRPDETQPEPGLIVFTGAMGWAPNALAAEFLVRRVLPIVRRRVPAARVALVGRSPGPEVLALTAIEGVEVTGEVPDLRPWLRRASAYACPMTTGTGIKNKLLEAMACGAACVATPLACQGIAATDGAELLLAADEQSFASALVRVLGDPELGRRLGEGARSLVLERHRWADVARAYVDLYERVRAAAPSAAVRTSASRSVVSRSSRRA
jgi:polysaccharide biosynthesis protein PslH